ncbi:hypothetical protein [Micromonospora sp. NPDC023633]|uniref:hypothetical protein n=1 Tax=Micromonospora sp. NPDC023633 TaxID=3154320 RepID=UPI0033D0B54F
MTYNADASHALPAVLIESLVQSRPGLLRLLPAALPGLGAGVLRGVACAGRPAGDGSASRSCPGPPAGSGPAWSPPVAQRLTVRSPYGGRDVDLVAATPVEVAFAAPR